MLSYVVPMCMKVASIAEKYMTRVSFTTSFALAIHTILCMSFYKYTYCDLIIL